VADFRLTRRTGRGSRQDFIRWRRRADRLDPSGGVDALLVDDVGSDFHIIDDDFPDDVLLIQD